MIQEYATSQNKHTWGMNLGTRLKSLSIQSVDHIQYKIFLMILLMPMGTQIHFRGDNVHNFFGQWDNVLVLKTWRPTLFHALDFLFLLVLSPDISVLCIWLWIMTLVSNLSHPPIPLLFPWRCVFCYWILHDSFSTNYSHYRFWTFFSSSVLKKISSDFVGLCFLFYDMMLI